MQIMETIVRVKKKGQRSKRIRMFTFEGKMDAKSLEILFPDHEIKIYYQLDFLDECQDFSKENLLSNQPSDIGSLRINHIDGGSYGDALESQQETIDSEIQESKPKNTADKRGSSSTKRRNKALIV